MVDRIQRKPVIGIFSVACVLAAACLFRCPKEVNVYIGEFPSRDAGLRAAIKRLPQEIDRCPGAEGYRVMWRGPDPEDGRVDREALLYFRRPRALGFEHDVYSGISGRAYVVDEVDIRVVAEKGGTLEDFAEYDNRLR
jgi:hypothetical protein